MDYHLPSPRARRTGSAVEGLNARSRDNKIMKRGERVGAVGGQKEKIPLNENQKFCGRAALQTALSLQGTEV